ncbi:MAG: carboxypeptidase regulatory-like domain-containing protein [Bryobacteraceae bacterium]
MGHRTRLLRLAALALLFAALLPGQTSNQGALVGTVTDQTGSVIAGVDLSLRNTATGVIRTTKSNEVGDYRFDFVLPGEYELTAAAGSFKKLTNDSISVRVGEIRRLDLRLEVGATTESVTVTADIGSLNTETASLGEVVDSKKIQDLPLNGREFLALAALVPGAESGSVKRGTVYSRGYAIGINGGRATYNGYFIDGADANTSNGTLASSPTLEAIREFRIETNMYSAQYGRSGSAVINVVTKGGTNEIHGSLFEFHRNKALDALPWNYQGTRKAFANYLFNQFGGSAGGPVIKNKTFVFGAVEYFRQLPPGTLSIGFSPTDKERAGDYSESINPYSQRPVVLRNPFTNEIFPDSKLPASLVHPIGRRLMDEVWPKANYSGDRFLNLRSFFGGKNKQNKYLFRGDHHLSSKDIIYGTFDWNNYDNDTLSWNQFANSTYYQRAKTVSGTYTRTFSPTLLNDLKLSYLMYDDRTGPTLADKNYGGEFGIASTIHRANGFPQLYLYGPTFMAAGGTGVYQFQNHTTYLRDVANWIKGKHTFSFGGDWRRQNHDHKSIAGWGGAYFGFLDGQPGRETQYWNSGSTFSAMLMALPIMIDGGLGEDRLIPLRRNATSFFAQDDWKVTSRLTLNLGLRYDYEEPFKMLTNQFMTLNFQTGLPRYAKGLPGDVLRNLRFKYETGGPNYPFNANKKDFAPRVGFAYRPFNDNKTVFRGGYGMFYTSERAETTINGSSVIPFAGYTGYIYARGRFWPDGQDRFRNLAEGPPAADIVQVTTGSPGNYTPTDPFYPTGYLQQWNFTIGRDVGFRTVVQLGYVGSRGVNLNSWTTVGRSLPGVLALVRQQNPTWGGDRGLRQKGFSSAYHGLQLNVRKEYSHGLSFLANYTWSRAMSDGSEDSDNEHTFFNNEIAGEIIRRGWSSAAFDVRHRANFSGSWEVPVGRGKTYGAQLHPVLDGFVGGWSGNWILTLQGGYPWTVTTGFASWTRPDRLCDGNLPRGQKQADRWFDYTCFVTRTPTVVVNPATGQNVTINNQGNAGPNIIVGPGTTNLDFGLHKNFRLTENKHFQFRTELFNAFNTSNLQAPNWQFFANNATGAKITRAGPKRQIQFGLKFIF